MSCWAFTGVSPRLTTTSSGVRENTKHTHAVRQKDVLVRTNRIAKASAVPRARILLKHRIGRELPNTYPARYSLIAFVSRFGIDSNEAFHGVAVMRSMSKRIACLCVLLTFWSAIAFAAHQHSNATDSATCTVCIAAHSASPKTTITLPRVLFVSVSTFLPEPISAKQCLIVFALCVRPPPSV